MTYLRVKNWDKFQHYKDRNAPWIKLHRALLDDYEFASLPDAARGHLMLIWLLAVSYDGRIPSDAGFLARKLATTETIDLRMLISKGFLVPEQDASDVLATRKQDASDVLALARSREGEGEGEREEPTCASADARRRPGRATTSDGFERFWSAYPRKVSKGRAQKTWAKLKPSEQLVQAIIAGIGRAKTSAQWTRDAGQYIPHPATWLNDRGWEDEQSAPTCEPGQWWLKHGHGTRDAAIAAGVQEPYARISEPA